MVAKKKLSISLREDLFVRAREAAELEGIAFSAWMTRATEEAVRIADARQALEDYIQIYGPPDDEATAEMDRKLTEAGYFQQAPAEDEHARLRALARLAGRI